MIDDIEELRKQECEKYTNLYMDKDNFYKNTYDHRGYGRGNWGGEISDLILNLSADSILDIGCGYGYFCSTIKSRGIKNVYGLDIASVKTNNIIDDKSITFINGVAHSLPFKDNEIDIITSFDVLEHCLRSDIDLIFNEMYRVCKIGCIFTISYRPSQELYKKLPLHMTVEPEIWWIEKLSELFSVEGTGRYLICFKDK
jgi:ubiquinone/menaquinone biosynthesis C-methylase UbiE